MKIVKPGHVYELQCVDTEEVQRITFVCREPQMLLHGGVQTQEVLRMLIDRTMHCDNCLPHRNNDPIIYHLRMALVLHEARALERKVEKGLIEPENIATMAHDGHYALAFHYLGDGQDYVKWSARHQVKK